MAYPEHFEETVTRSSKLRLIVGCTALFDLARAVVAAVGELHS